MRLANIRIQNLRGIKDTTIHLDEKLTVLIGGNNAGKTTVLDALNAVMTHRHGSVAFQESDFRSEQEGLTIRDAPPIVIDLKIVPSEGTRFLPYELGQHMHQDIDSNGEESLTLRLITAFNRDPAMRRIDSVLRQKTDDSVAIGSAKTGDGVSFPFREQLPFRAFGIERDIRRGTQQRWSDWGRLLADIPLQDAVVEKAMTDLRSGDTHLFEQTKELREIGRSLASATQLIGFSDAALTLSAIPADPEQLMRQMSVVLKQPGASRGFSAERQGMGTQGALLFAFYEQFVRVLTKQDAIGTFPILTVEEPETHLHPCAQRAMAKQLANLPGQVIATSHSPDLVRSLTSQQVVVMRSGSEGSNAYHGTLEPKTLRDHAHALFARVIMVMEGEEAHMMPHLAEALGIDLFGLNIEIINAAGQNSIPPLWEALGLPGFGFPVVCVGDADQGKPLRDFLKKAVDFCPDYEDAKQELQDAHRLAAVATRSIAELDGTQQNRLRSALRSQDYFCASVGCALEHTMAQDLPDLVDQAFAQLENCACDWPTWRRKHGGEDAKLPGRSDRPKVKDLNDVEVRVYWLCHNKTTAPICIAKLLKDTPKRIPDYLSLALQRAAALARC